ncbi:hypothetical protein [Clostridium perfringens]|uniref:hypothetical protein n=1 Tax=Clostridium perfringens TaxID=1502 RepID=UPI0013E39ADB|nr:hypothetical protein [Clostridium perfringens]MDM0868521.1 hypothetical protein [Clostridium perfringens]NGU52069.1 hypothetical protein [Clostridium perfringens]HAT4183699.1 hypothetical protein [Clostridium perfringens]HAT4218462.1 hypothetical protein [Clostridium perfringens]
MNIEILKGYNKRELALWTRKVKKEDIRNVLLNSGFYAKSTLKVDELLEILFDALDGIIEPSNEDKKKIESLNKRRAKKEVIKQKLKEEIKNRYLNQQRECFKGITSKPKTLEQLVKSKGGFKRSNKRNKKKRR